MYVHSAITAATQNSCVCLRTNTQQEKLIM